MPYCPYGTIKKCKNTTPTADVWNTNLESGAFNVELPACIIVYGLFVYSHYPIQCAWKNHIIGLHHFSNSQKKKKNRLSVLFLLCPCGQGREVIPGYICDHGNLEKL